VYRSSVYARFDQLFTRLCVLLAVMEWFGGSEEEDRADAPAGSNSSVGLDQQGGRLGWPLIC